MRYKCKSADAKKGYQFFFIGFLFIAALMFFAASPAGAQPLSPGEEEPPESCAGCPDTRRNPLCVTAPGTLHPLCVTSSADGPDGGTLRHRVMEANEAPGCCGSFTIVFARDVSTIKLTEPIRIDQESQAELSIEGPTERALTIDGQGQTNIFELLPRNAIHISNVSLINGRSGEDDEGGGAISNLSILTVTIDSCTISSNKSSGAEFGGGGILNTGDMIITNSTISGNSADGPHGGGGILSFGTMTINDSTISGNHSDKRGGGGIANIAAIADTTLMIITNSIISENDTRDNLIGGGILSTGELRLTNSIVSRNVARLAGGGIDTSGGSATLTDSTVSGNAAGFAGGGINRTGGGPLSRTSLLTLRNSTVELNGAGFDGGGVEIGEGRAVISNSTINNNAVGRFGGGIANSGSSTILSLANSTISGNTASGQMGASGGGIANINGARLTSNNVTITGNTASEGAGYFNAPGSTANIANTLIAQNTDDKDCAGTFNSRGGNLIGNNTDCEASFPFPTGDNPNANNDWVGVAALLDTLQPRGGLTRTHALQPGSPAINNGNPVMPLISGKSSQPLDQRGYEREDGPDIGAFEFGGRIF